MELSAVHYSIEGETSMVEKKLQDEIVEYNHGSQGTTAAMLAAFEKARKVFIDENIEWIVPFNSQFHMWTGD